MLVVDLRASAKRACRANARVARSVNFRSPFFPVLALRIGNAFCGGTTIIVRKHSWFLGCAIVLACNIADDAPATLNTGSIIAHRGHSSRAPENTLASIHAAAGVAHMTEFDVRTTADGVLILMHDATVNRTTNGTGSVSSMNYYGQINQLDAGSWFSSGFAGEPVPTLQQAVTTSLSHGLIPVIERKTGSAQQYYDVLYGMGVLGEVCIIAFDWSFIADMRALDSGVMMGALGSGTLGQTEVGQAKATGADYINWDHGTITRSQVDLVHGNGMPLMVWTVNDTARMRALLDMGVDAITTDDPARMAKLYAPAVVHWKLDGNLGNSGTGGSQYDGALVQGTSGNGQYVDGAFCNSQGLRLDSDPISDTQGVHVSSTYVPKNEGTIALWYNPGSFYNYNTIFDNSAHHNDWEFWIYDDGRARFRINRDNSSIVTYNLADLGAADDWRHLAVAWERQAGDPSRVHLRLYVDGQLRDSHTGNWADPDCLFLGGGNPGNTYGIGVWDDVRVYERMLTVEEIAALMVPEPCGALLLVNGLSAIAFTSLGRRKRRLAR